MPCRPSSATTVEAASWSCTRVLPFSIRLPNRKRHQHQHRHQRQDEQRQAGVQGQHDHDRADQRDHLAEQRGEVVGQHGAHLGHVAGQARDDIPHPPVGVKIERQALQVLIQGSAQVVDDVLADVSQQVGLQERESRLQQEDPAQQKRPGC